MYIPVELFFHLNPFFSNIQNFDSLLIKNGIHKNEISNGIIELTKKYNVNVNYTQTELKW